MLRSNCQKVNACFLKFHHFETLSFIFDSRIIDNCWKSYFVLKWHKHNFFFFNDPRVNHVTSYVCMQRSHPIKMETFFLEEHLHDYMEGPPDHENVLPRKVSISIGCDLSYQIWTHPIAFSHLLLEIFFLLMENGQIRPGFNLVMKLTYISLYHLLLFSLRKATKP